MLYYRQNTFPFSQRTLFPFVVNMNFLHATTHRDAIDPNPTYSGGTPRQSQTTLA